MANKRLILCLDGTWNNPYQNGQRDDGTQVMKPSNPLKIARVVAKSLDDNTLQLTYYDTGVGALGRYPGISNRILDFVDSKLGGAFGAGFEANVEQAFTFLCHNYEPGDQVFVFGFSRGAAQARGLTRFIDWVGGVPAKEDAYFIPMLFMEYLRTRGQGHPDSVKTSSGEGRQKQLDPLQIDFLGVWDTVMALGSRFRSRHGTSVVSRSFHVGEKPAKCVQHARHALATDELRYDFRPEIWNGKHDHQTLQQRWFPGVHSNVGGGYVKDGLANLSLSWFLEEARKLGLVDIKKFSSLYRGWPAAKLYRSHTMMYSVLEFLRFRSGKGARQVKGHSEASALKLDASVIHRMRQEPTNKTQMHAPYRPANVIEYLATKQDLRDYLLSVGLEEGKTELPADVMQAIEEARE